MCCPTIKVKCESTKLKVAISPLFFFPLENLSSLNRGNRDQKLLVGRATARRCRVRLGKGCLKRCTRFKCTRLTPLDSKFLDQQGHPFRHERRMFIHGHEMMSTGHGFVAPWVSDNCHGRLILGLGFGFGYRVLHQIFSDIDAFLHVEKASIGIN